MLIEPRLAILRLRCAPIARLPATWQLEVRYHPFDNPPLRGTLLCKQPNMICDWTILSLPSGPKLLHALLYYQRAPNPPELAQPRLSRVKRRSSPARRYKFVCVCSYRAGDEDAGVVTGHVRTNTPKFLPPRWGRPRVGPTQTGLCKFGWV